MVRTARWLIFLAMSSMSRMTPLGENSRNNSSVTERNKKHAKRNGTDENNNDTCWNCTTNISTTEYKREMCIEPAIDDFPGDIFTQDQRLKGGFIFHLIIILYACYAIAVVCDDYFVPSLEVISLKTKMSSDVAGATLMAAGTSAPELFESVIGTFITNGDIGVGTIVGSALYNILAVTCFCGLFSGMVVPLEWWPLTRDCLFYLISVAALIAVIIDEKVYWYESTVLLVLFGLYILAMVHNRKLELFATKIVNSMKCQKKNETAETSANNGICQPSKICVTNKQMSISEGDAKNHSGKDTQVTLQSIESFQTVSSDNINSEDEKESEEKWLPLAMPKGTLKRAIWFATWPINFIFYITLFDVKSEKWRNFFPATFLLSIVYLGVYCYIVAWMTVNIGFTFGVPDTVMGISLMAIAISVPEGFSSVIVCKKGLGNMAISNSVGSNAFDILICLGLPWLIKALTSKDVNYATIHSGGIIYSIIFLIVSILIMYGSVAIFGFKLNKKVGVTCLVAYVSLVALACCVELNVFGYINPPPCAM